MQSRLYHLHQGDHVQVPWKRPWRIWVNKSYASTWWRHQMETFPRYWPIVRGIHRLTVNSPHKGQWRGGLMFSLICAWINGRVNNREAGDLRRHGGHYDVTIMTRKAKSNHNKKRHNKPVCTFHIRDILHLIQRNYGAPFGPPAPHKLERMILQWNLSVTTTSIIKSISCDLFSNVF